MRLVFWAYGLYSTVYSFNFWRYILGMADDNWACDPGHFWDEINWGWTDMRNHG